MQIDAKDVLAFFSAILSLLVGAWAATARYAIANKEKELDRRIDDQAKKTEAIDTRLHTEEKATIRQDGEIARVRDTHDNITDDVDEIKRHMVTKGEIMQLEKTIERRFDELQGRERERGYVPRPTPGAYRGLGTSETNPPKNK